jgi:hypothetical protein
LVGSLRRAAHLHILQAQRGLQLRHVEPAARLRATPQQQLLHAQHMLCYFRHRAGRLQLGLHLQGMNGVGTLAHQCGITGPRSSAVLHATHRTAHIKDQLAEG